MTDDFPLASFFRDSAARDPERIALVWEGGELTYRSFRALVEGLRRGLEGHGGQRVGILAHRSPTAYAAVQAILSEGCAYVPMNPGFPGRRNAYIARKASLSALIVGEECADALKELLPELDVPMDLVVMGDCPKVRAVAALTNSVRVVECLPVAGPSHALAPMPEDGSAYVLFTSGSTGEPKGVRVLQSNVVSYVRSFQSLYPILPEDRVSQTFDITFDVSVHDQFVTWAAGATLVSYPEKALMAPIGWTRDQRVTVWFSVPALAAFLETTRQVVPGALPDLRLSLFAGEKLTWKTTRVWQSIAPNSRMANLYGPTEATIAITQFPIPEDFPEERCHQGGIPIGIAMPGQVCEVRREDGSICAPNELGELWVAGDQIAPGYLGEPAKTAERFIARDGKIWYRTGDLVFAEPDGTIQYQGRLDFQVKVMGYRIELGEIEHALLKASGASFSVADVAAFRGEMDEIYGVLPALSASLKKEIKAHLKEVLPSYMVPRKLLFTDDIPLNSNGKIDRNALKAAILAGTIQG